MATEIDGTLAYARRLYLHHKTAGNESAANDLHRLIKSLEDDKKAIETHNKMIRETTVTICSDMLRTIDALRQIV